TERGLGMLVAVVAGAVVSRGGVGRRRCARASGKNEAQQPRATKTERAYRSENRCILKVFLKN
ncbi:MAG TPA: hypothetical protein VNA19_06215, partial [Pyrinomonadaceae bacterium]|nr:hypothetical protein [Pyrinomonadaceae bacterium]